LTRFKDTVSRRSEKLYCWIVVTKLHAPYLVILSVDSVVYGVSMSCPPVSVINLKVNDFTKLGIYMTSRATSPFYVVRRINELRVHSLKDRDDDLFSRIMTNRRNELHGAESFLIT
jgi:hypothetical protein